LNIWKYFHITYPTALGVMSISSSMRAAYREMFQHHSLNPGLIRQAFRHHGRWQATA
jgi:hypothetical protein